MEFAAGRIEGVLLLFRTVVDQWAAVGMNRLAKKSLCSNLSQMEPDEIIVRKDGHDTFFASAIIAHYNF